MMRYILAHSEARRRAAAAVTSAPDGYVITISAPKRSSDINAALHAKLGEISKSRDWAGRKWDSEAWKRLMVAAWSRANAEPAMAVPALDGYGVDLVYRRTSEMTQSEVSSLMSYIEAWEADHD